MNEPTFTVRFSFSSLISDTHGGGWEESTYEQELTALQIEAKRKLIADNPRSKLEILSIDGIKEITI